MLFRKLHPFPIMIAIHIVISLWSSPVPPPLSRHTLLIIECNVHLLILFNRYAYIRTTPPPLPQNNQFYYYYFSTFLSLLMSSFSLCPDCSLYFELIWFHYFVTSVPFLSTYVLVLLWYTRAVTQSTIPFEHTHHRSTPSLLNCHTYTRAYHCSHDGSCPNKSDLVD